MQPQSQTPQLEWFTVGEAARYLGIASSTFRNWVDAGRVPSYTTPGGHRRVTREALDRLLAPADGNPPMPDGRKPHVLVIDDQREIRTMLRSCFESEGFEVAEAESVRDGMLAINRRIPDLLLLDICMPGADGWTMLRMIRAKLDVADLPVVVFSGQDDLRGAEWRGAQGYVRKPFDPLLLVGQARALISIGAATNASGGW